MTLIEIKTRLDFVKHVYEMEIISQLDERHLEEAKADLKAFEYMNYILDERIKQNGGSEEKIYSK